MSRRALVTGATGMVGSQLVASLASNGWIVRAATRTRPATEHVTEWVRIPSLLDGPAWDEAVVGCDTVYHLAALVHQAPGHAANAAYDVANIDATRALALASVDAKVRRFIFASSVKVHGDEADHPLRTSDVPCPVDAYGRSKLAAELELRSISARTGMEVVCVRPPLVYGPGVKANFRALLHTASLGWPLPLGSIKNRRSLINVWNLCDFLVACATLTEAAGKSWLVSDGDDVSTPELFRRCAFVQSAPSRQFPLPVRLLEGIATAVGRRQTILRLTRSLSIDLSETTSALGWVPRVGMEDALRRIIAEGSAVP